MNPYALRGITGALSDSISKLHDERLKKQHERELNARAIGESLLKMGNNTMKSRGLAIIAGLTGDDKNVKDALKDAEKLIADAPKNPKYGEASQMLERINAQEGGGQPEMAPTPTPTQAPAPSPTPKQAPQFMGPPDPPPEIQEPISALTTGGPPSAPSFTSPAAGNASNPTQQGTGLNLTPSAGAQAGPPSPPREIDPRQEFFSRNPLTFEDAYTPELQTASRERTAEANRTAQMDRLELQLSNRIAMASGKDYVLSGVEAELAGVPEGSTVNPKIFGTLMREKGANIRAAAKASLTRELEGGRDRRTGSFSPEYDADGNLLGYVNPKTREQQAPGFEGARKPLSAGAQDKVTGRKILAENVGLVRDLITGNEDLIGPGVGASERVKRVFNAANPKWVELDDLLNRMSTGQLYELTGKAAAEWERAGIRRMVPQLSTLESSPQLFQQQLNGFERAVEQFLDTYQGGVGSRKPAKPSSGPPARPSTITGGIDPDVMSRLDKYN